MIIIGLTGSIGMGKSTTAALFEQEGVPVYDADAAVHELYAMGGAAVEPIEAAFPGVTKGGGVDRAALSARVLGNPDALKKLENIVHPLVVSRRQAFLETVADQEIVALDVPLLFETGGENQVDIVVVVTAPSQIQRERVLARPGMTAEKLDAILARQMRDAEKCARAHFVIDTQNGLDDARYQVREIIAALRQPSAPLLPAALERGGEAPQ